MKATSKCSIIFLLRYNQDGDVKGKQDNARDNDGPYYIYFKPIWYQKNYLLFLSSINDKHRFGDCMQNVFNDFFKIERFVYQRLAFFYPGSVSWSAMCAVFPGHTHLFLKINVCNFLVNIQWSKHHNSSFLIHHYKENKQT